MLTPQEKLKKLQDLKNPSNPGIKMVIDRIESLKGDTGPMGPEGKTPIKGVDYFTEPEVSSIVIRVQSLIRIPSDGVQGIQGIQGRPGETPERGVHYWTQADQEKIIKDVISRIPKPKDGVNPSIEDIAAKVTEELSKKPVHFKDIKGTEQLIAFLKSGGFRGGGGGTSTGITGLIQAGTNVSITGTGILTDPYIINSTATAIELQTNGTDNGSQSLLNLVAGNAVSLTDNGSGNVTIAVPSGSVTFDQIGSGTNTTATMTVGSGATFNALTGSFKLEDTSDPTKKLAFGISGFSTGVTRTITIPNLSTTVAVLGNPGTQQFTSPIVFSPGSETSPTTPYFQIINPTQSSIAANTELIGMKFDSNTNTVRFTDGTIAMQRAVVFTAPKYSPQTSSLTITKASTVAIAGAPTASGGGTITNAYSFWVQAGMTQLDGGLNTTTATISTMTAGSVFFAGTGGILSQNNNNFYIQNSSTTPQTLATNTNVALSVNTNGDFTGTNAINTYSQYDAYLPNSLITNSLSGLNTDGAVPGYTATSSRGTGTSPIQLNTGDLAGGFFGFGAQGASSPTYQNLGGMAITTVGASANNLGGQLNWYTKADGGSLALNAYIENNGNYHIGSVAAGTTNDIVTGSGLEVAGSNNTAGGVNMIVSNSNSGTSAFADVYLQNNLADATATHFAVLNYNSSNYSNTAFGTAIAVANQLALYGTDGPTLIGAFNASSPQYINFVVGGNSTTNEIARISTLGISIGTQANAVSQLTIGGNVTKAAWGVNGPALQTLAATFTDNSTAAGATVTAAYINTIGIPTITAANATSGSKVTYGTISTLYIAGNPTLGANTLVTNNGSMGAQSFALNVNGNVHIGGGLLSDGTYYYNGSVTGRAFNSSANLGVANLFVISDGTNNTSTANYLWGSGTTTDYRGVYGGGGTASTLGASANYAGGILVTPTILKVAASGTHQWLNNATILGLGTVTANGGTAATNTASLYIGSASSFGTNNYTLYTETGNVKFNNGNLTLGTAGNALFITEGTNGRVGQVALVAGTKAITITGLTTSSRAFVTLVTANTTTLTTTYQAVCTSNTLTLQANVQQVPLT